MAELTANEAFLDALIRHQIYLTRLGGSLRDKILALLDATERDIESAIQRRLENNQGFDTKSAARLAVLQRVIIRIRGTAWDKVDELWVKELTELAKYEPSFTLAAVRTAAPVLIDAVLPQPEQLRSIVKSLPFEGRTMKQWSQKMRADDLGRIMGQIQVGMVQGESSPQIARRVFGTRAMQGRDGVTQITRSNAESISRTAVNFVSNATRRELFKTNEDLFSLEQYVATLDSRTTPVCRANDGKRFPVGKGPIPPLHFGCRSTRVAVMDGQVFGERPAKPSTERMLVREFTEKHGLDPVSSRDKLPRGQKGLYDAFARKRVRDLTGTVPAHTSYQDWLMKQSNAFQDDVLGKTRAKLFRSGGLKLDKFVNRAGDQLNLAELARRERQAFIDAGLDPEDF